jgi:cytochrome b561
MHSSGDRYTLPAIALHWLMALAIVATFLLGLSMTGMPGLSPTKLKYFSWHKWMGVTVLGLACLRLLWRLTHQAPAYPGTMAAWQRTAAHGVHGSLYLLIFAVPLSGYFFSLAAGVPVVYLGVLPLPAFIAPDPHWKAILRETHYVLNMVLLGAVCVHVLAALKHLLIDRDGLFRRMLP